MEPKLRQAIDAQFAGAPDNAQANELKEEIIRNTIERYRDLLSRGKPEEEACALALDSVGDVDELMESFGVISVQKTRDPNRLFLLILALFLIAAGAIPLFFPGFYPYSLAFLDVMAAVAVGILVFRFAVTHTPHGKTAPVYTKRAFLRGAGVACFVLCLLPFILLFATPLFETAPILAYVVGAAGAVLVVLSLRVGSVKPQSGRTHPSYYVLLGLLWAATVCAIVTTPFSAGLRAVPFSLLFVPWAVCFQIFLKAFYRVMGVSR